MSSTKVKEWFYQILHVTIPTFLLRKLTYCYEKVRLRKRLHPTSQGTLAGERRVYDLVNCGPRQRFVVSPLSPLIVHNCSYGAGAGKISQALQLQGVDVDYDKAKEMHAKYWQLFAKVKQYEQFLQTQWERNEGWILNPIGRPLAVAQDYLRDVVNRSIQSGGHDCFVLYLSLLSTMLRDTGVLYKPYVWDLHDAVMLTVPEEQVEQAVHIMDHKAMNELNRRLNGKVKLKGETNVVDNWAADKFG